VEFGSGSLPKKSGEVGESCQKQQGHSLFGNNNNNNQQQLATTKDPLFLVITTTTNNNNKQRTLSPW